MAADPGAPSLTFLGTADSKGVPRFWCGCAVCQEARTGGRGVYDVREALRLPWARSGGRVVLTHLSHGVDVSQVALPPGWTFAHDGLTVPL